MYLRKESSHGVLRELERDTNENGGSTLVMWLSIHQCMCMRIYMHAHVYICVLRF